MLRLTLLALALLPSALTFATGFVAGGLIALHDPTVAGWLLAFWTWFRQMLPQLAQLLSELIQAGGTG